MKKLSVTSLVLVLLALAAGCGSSESDSTGSTGATASSCEPGELATKTEGKLTVATDEPAYPPYFEDDDPTNGEGFESAVAYAIAATSASRRPMWIGPSSRSTPPTRRGRKTSISTSTRSRSPRPAKRRSTSRPLLHGEPGGCRPEGLRRGQRDLSGRPEGGKIGVQIGTTSLDGVEEKIEPDEKPQVFNSSNDVVTALKNEQIDAVVVDLPTALYLTAAQVPTAKVVGQFSVPGGDQWGALLEKESELTSCISQAVEELEESGELEEITQRWMSKAAGAPELS